METNFNNKKILVTGAGHGIGRGIVKLLAKCGAKVVALSLVDEELKSLKQELPEVTTITCDVTDSARVRELVAAHGPYHGLVNNAGIVEVQPFLQVTEESIDRLLKVNLKAAIIISQVVVKMMIDNKIKGTIVNVSSRVSQCGVKGVGVYSASKAGLDAISRVMALELGDQGIRVNCVNPTVVPETNIGSLFNKDPVKIKQFLDQIPLHKFAEVEDVANAVVFLLSDSSKMINAITLLVDGGINAV